jgi:hypothetical protein
MRSLACVGVVIALFASASVARADDPRTELGSPIDVTAPIPRAPRPRIRSWEIRLVGFGYGELFGARSRPSQSLALGLALYGRLTPWASLGARLYVSQLGWADSGGLIIDGGLALPSIRLSFREEIDSVVAIECGVHVEAGFFGGRHGGGGRSAFGQGAFGFGGGLEAALDLGPSNAIVLDLVLEGWGANGGYAAWLFATLGYSVRFD